MRKMVLFAACFVLLACLSCASSKPKPDIEGKLISAFITNCKTVETKIDEDMVIYMITPTQRVSGKGCPIALIRGWKEGNMIKEKEVEICECKEKK